MIVGEIVESLKICYNNQIYKLAILTEKIILQFSFLSEL